MDNQLWALLAACVVGLLLALGSEGKDASRIGTGLSVGFLLFCFVAVGVGLWVAAQLRVNGFDLWAIANAGGVR